MSRLGLGTAQFGLAYGIANCRGPMSDAALGCVLAEARAAGMDTLDTAVAYGNSEERLGDAGVDGWHVVSKLPPVPTACSDVRAWVLNEVRGSLGRLRQERLYGLLLHRPQELVGPNGRALHDGLFEAKAKGLVTKVGLSIYDPCELEELEDRFGYDLVQAPLNVFDRRIAESGWLARLAGRGQEVHVRSVFLQGLLVLGSAQRPKQFNRWQQAWNRWDRWLCETGLTAVQVCVRFVLDFAGPSRVIVGIDSVEHLREVVSAADAPALQLPGDLEVTDLELIQPSNWQLR